jgi:MarR family transcriptional regulator, transcriptional regulator for hemolysin
MNVEKPESVIFYYLDKGIKSYRQFAQNRLNESGLNITVDQWLIMNVINEDPEVSQQEIAEKVFKDNASVTRIIELLVKKGYIKRTILNADRRRTKLEVTKKGTELIKEASKVVNAYRRVALKGISEPELKRLRIILDKMITNCETKA